jgi:cyclic pyranopterin phosphate synthase
LLSADEIRLHSYSADRHDQNGRCLGETGLAANGHSDRFYPATKDTIRKINELGIAKGNVLAVAHVAAENAVKRTDELIPLCHSLAVQHVDVLFREKTDGIEIECTAATRAQTGVEMEALTGVSIAGLAIYDMCKAIDKTMEISGIHLLSKRKKPL